MMLTIEQAFHAEPGRRRRRRSWWAAQLSRKVHVKTKQGIKQAWPKHESRSPDKPTCRCSKVDRVWRRAEVMNDSDEIWQGHELDIVRVRLQ